MLELHHKLMIFLQYPFVYRALVAGIMISLCSSLLGVTLVMKRLSFIGDGLSHVAFGIMCIAAVMNLSDDMLLILPVTIICAIFLISKKDVGKTKGDAALAMLSVSSLAIGYLLMNIFSASSNVSGDVCTTLFGSVSILTLSNMDMIISIILSIIIVAVYILLYKKIFIVTFDPCFAESIGINTKHYNNLIAVISAVVIVLAMRLVGSLLVTALVIFPVISAMHIFKSYKLVLLFSVVLSIISSATGILAAVMLGTPVGATIVVFNICIFIVSKIAGRMRKW